MPLLPCQIRAARGLLGWSAEQLAEASQLSRDFIEQLESRDGPCEDAAASAICKALKAAGVEFLNDGAPGVRLRPSPRAIRPEELNSANDG